MKLRISSTPESLRTLQEWVESWWSVEWGEAELRYTLEIVLEELFQNSLHHGQALGMEVECFPLADGVHLVWSDNGIAFDSTQRGPERSPALSLEETPIGGVGLSMLADMTCNLLYQRKSSLNVITCLIPKSRN